MIIRPGIPARAPAWAEHVARLWQRAATVPGMPWLLLVFAVGTYALYANAGLNLGGEGGTAGVVAQRLMAGQRPIVDTFLGYNVFWFSPLAALFELTGPNYLVLRWYFFAFCTASGLLTYFVVCRFTRHAAYSAIPAVMVILVPGMLFRNYMPFLGILNAFLLTRAWVVRRSSRGRTLAWIVASGAGLGVTYLFRIDLGIFSTVIFLGLAVLYPIGERGTLFSRAAVGLGGAAAGLAVAWAIHLPVWNDARARGYDQAFLEQYTGWLGMIQTELGQHVADLAEGDKPPDQPTAVPAIPEAAPPAPEVLPGPSPHTVEAKKPNADSWEDRGALVRAPLSDAVLGRKWVHKSFAISTYLPVFVAAIAIVAGSLALLASLIRRDPEAKERALYPLTVLGCALMLLPQFLFFRPDTPHLSEMMVPFIAALALLVWSAVRAARASQSMVARTLAAGFAALCAATGIIYFSHGIQKESAGSAAALRGVAQSFRGLNGVDVRVKPSEAIWLEKLQAAVVGHSSPGEFVLCLPYSPTINFMTDRPSPLHNLYVDNTTAGGWFEDEFLRIMAQKKPPVVVIDQRRINRNEISRFSNWAPGPYQWLHKNYVYVGRYFRSEVFVRPDKVVGPVTPEAVEVSD